MNKLKNATKFVFEILFALLGVNEILFLAGFYALFTGVRGLWSLDGAYAVSGALLIAIAIGGIVFAQKKVE